MLSRRALLPLLGAVPLQWGSSEPIPRTSRTRLLFGGDVMLSRHVARLARQRHDPASPLQDIAPVFQAADIAFVNLEAPFSDRGPVMERGMVFKTEPEMVAALEMAGIDVVSTANNHARDCGSHGIEYTLDWLAKHNISSVGTGRSRDAAHAGTILDRNGIRFGFLAYTYDQSNGNYSDTDERIALMKLDDLRADIQRMEPLADVVIVSMHAGIEYEPKPNSQQVRFARAAIDAGACVVVGSHPHVTQRWERYGSGVVFYSLGNLVFDQFQRQETQRGLLAEVVFEGKVLTQTNVLPVEIVRTVPRLAAGVALSTIEMQFPSP